MSEGPAVLVVSRDPGLIEHLRTALRGATGSLLHVAGEPSAALDQAREHGPALVFVDAAVRETGAASFVPRLRALVPHSILVLAISGGDGATMVPSGVDGLIARPPDAPHVLAQLRLAERVARLENELTLASEEGRRLEQEKRSLEEQFHALLITLVGLGVPGGIDRSTHIADLARKLAERYHVPEKLIPDLVTVARLHELGRLASWHSETPQPIASAWEYAQRTQALLEQVDAFQAASELVAEIFENWDGTGHPQHLQQGQIPLRCRILRVLIDFFAILERANRPTPERAIEELARHGGTLYDPLVIVHLRSLLEASDEDGWHGANAVVPIEELREGMVLAEDLYSTNGVKLLARGTALNRVTLEIILNRHRAEPILQGATVVRETA